MSIVISSEPENLSYLAKRIAPEVDRLLDMKFDEFQSAVVNLVELALTHQLRLYVVLEKIRTMERWKDRNFYQRESDYHLCNQMNFNHWLKNTWGESLLRLYLRSRKTMERAAPMLVASLLNGQFEEPAIKRLLRENHKVQTKVVRIVAERKQAAPVDKSRVEFLIQTVSPRATRKERDLLRVSRITLCRMLKERDELIARITLERDQAIMREERWKDQFEKMARGDFPIKPA